MIKKVAFLSGIWICLFSCEKDNSNESISSSSKSENEYSCELTFNRESLGVDTTTFMSILDENWTYVFSEGNGIYALFNQENLNSEILDAATDLVNDPNSDVTANYSLTGQELLYAESIADLASMIIFCDGLFTNEDKKSTSGVAGVDCAVAIGATLFVTALAVGVTVGSGGWATGVGAWAVSKAFATYGVISSC